jgi:hypothetical protein
MCVSKHSLGPIAFALVLSGFGFLHGCGNLGCLRNSDCGSHLECHQGECINPNAPSTGGQPHDAAEAGGAGEGTGGTTSR